MFDGAMWHTSNSTIAVYERLNIPVLISAPYSYDGSPIELLFSCLKRGDINPDDLPLTKSKFYLLNLILVGYL